MKMFLAAVLTAFLLATAMCASVLHKEIEIDHNGVHYKVAVDAEKYQHNSDEQTSEIEHQDELGKIGIHYEVPHTHHHYDEGNEQGVVIHIELGDNEIQHEIHEEDTVHDHNLPHHDVGHHHNFDQTDSAQLSLVHFPKYHDSEELEHEEVPFNQYHASGSHKWAGHLTGGQVTKHHGIRAVYDKIRHHLVGGHHGVVQDNEDNQDWEHHHNFDQTDSGHLNLGHLPKYHDSEELEHEEVPFNQYHAAGSHKWAGHQTGGQVTKHHGINVVYHKIGHHLVGEHHGVVQDKEDNQDLEHHHNFDQTDSGHLNLNHFPKHHDSEEDDLEHEEIPLNHKLAGHQIGGQVTKHHGIHAVYNKIGQDNPQVLEQQKAALSHLLQIVKPAYYQGGISHVAPVRFQNGYGDGRVFIGGQPSGFEVIHPNHHWDYLH